jgi:molybdate transport system regulatory protein
VALARDASAGVNRLDGVIVDREDGDEASEIRLTLTAGKTLVATTSRRQADDLGLSVGERVVALIEPANIILAVE